MVRTLVATIVFAALYGLALRIYHLLRTRREADRWHLPAVVAASLVGAIGFYAAQQIRDPRAPRLLDAAAFLIMAVAAGAIPLMLEVALVVRARFLRDSTLRAPAQVPPHEPASSDGDRHSQ